MTRAARVRAFIALAVVAMSVYLTLTVSPRLGLDLRGGTHIVLETQDSPTVRADRKATDHTVEVLRRRIDSLGVAEPNLARSGDNRIVVELPGLQDPKEAAEVLGRTAQLSFHPVLGGPEERTDQEKKHVRPVRDEAGRPLRLGPAGLTGAGVDGADPRTDPQTGGGWSVSVDFRKEGKEKWAELTGEAACAAPGAPERRVAIVLDDEVISSPQVDPSVKCGAGIAGGSTEITGDFGEGEAKDLALLISGGALPVPVETLEQRTVGPTLGAEAIRDSAWAAVIGTSLTSLFIIGVYRLLGGLAALALVCYGVISYAVLVTLGATLTLPGLAGFVLAIGMAVDANVLVFERAREEYAAERPAERRGRGLRSALAAGFRNASSAIADSNVTTLLAAGLLFFLASGPVRGFGVTLSIGVLVSMFSALVVTRALAEPTVARRSLRARPRLSGIAQTGRLRQWLTERKPDWMRYGRRWLAVSAVALVLAVSGIVFRGLELGVEFTGGRLIEYSTSGQVAPEDARSALTDAGFPQAVVQSSGDGGDLTVRTEALTEAQEDKVTAAVTGVDAGAEKVRDELIGPSLGDELRTGALIAFGVALVAQLGYLAVRFRWTFGTATVAAMAHDVVILVGAFAWLGKPVDGIFLAAVLTVIGYSVNDSVVVFDRVRELRGAEPEGRFAGTVNKALLQTVPRTVNTGLGAVFILVALGLLGGDSLTDFAVALLIGILVGTWSSMFTAAPLVIELEARRSNAAVPVRSGAPVSRPAE